MRKPRLEAFDPTLSRRQPEEIDVQSIVPMAPRAKLVFPTNQVLPQQKPMESSESKLASLQASKQSSLQTSLLAVVKELTDKKATNTATFRFPPELLEQLAEVEYLIQKNHKVKATKNAVVVGALAYLLLDYEKNATNSILYHCLVEK